MEEIVKSKLRSLYQNAGVSKEQGESFVLLTLESIRKFSGGENYIFKQRALSILKALDPADGYLMSKVLSEGTEFLETLYTLPSTELNPEARQKKLDDAYIEYDIPEYEKPGYRGMFQCGKCKSWKTEHKETFSRSADEPSVKMVNCKSCYYVFKFC